jgi:hypothetical protein
MPAIGASPLTHILADQARERTANKVARSALCDVKAVVESERS